MSLPASVLQAAQPAQGSAVPVEGAEAAEGLQGAAEAPGAPVEAVERFGWLKRLFRPTSLRPGQFRGRPVARTVNWLMDRRMGVQGASQEAEFGESSALCVAAAMGDDEGNPTPIGYLAGSLSELSQRVTVESDGRPSEPAVRN